MIGKLAIGIVAAGLVAAAPAFAQQAPRVLLGGEGAKSAVVRNVENGVAVWRGPALSRAAATDAALLGAVPHTRLERVVEKKVVVIRDYRRQANRLRTHGFYSGGPRRGKPFTQGFYSGYPRR